MAIALQLVFANLGIALGLTVLDLSPARSLPAQPHAKTETSQRSDLERSESERSDSASYSLPVTHLLGFGVAIGFSSVIFIATLLSVEFSEIFEPLRGIIFGLFFWATYWLLFVWLSSTTISSIADSLLGTALKGGKQLISTIKKAVQRPETRPSDEPITEQSILRELVAEVSQIRDVQQELPALLADQKEALIAEICDRTDLSSAAAETLIQELKPTSAPTSTTVSTSVTTSAPASAPTSAATSVSTSSVATSALMAQLDLPSWQQILRRTLNKVNLSDWDVETLWQQLPLESDKVQRVGAQLVESAITVLPDALSSPTATPSTATPSTAASSTAASSTATSLSSSVASPIAKAIQSKLVAYCRYTNTDLLTPEKLAEKVSTLREEYQLPDSQAIANIPLDIPALDAVLSRRQTLTPAERENLTETLHLLWPTGEFSSEDSNTVSKQSLEDVDLSVQAAAQKAYQTLEKEFQSIDWSQMSLEDIKPEVDLLLKQLEQKGTLRSLDWSVLISRIQLPDNAKADFTDWLKSAWINKVDSLGTAAVDSAQVRSQQVADQIAHFLHRQEKSNLDPAKIAEHLTQVVSKAIVALPNPSEEINAEKIDLSTVNNWLDNNWPDKDAWDKKLWDKDAWQQALEERKDLTVEEIQQILDWAERDWRPKVQQVSSWLQAIKSEVSEHLQLPDLHLSDLSLSDLSLPDLSQVDLSLPDLSLPDGHLLAETLAETRQQIVEQIVAAQENVTGRAIAIKEDLQLQADAARRQVAIAAWWLFIALISSGSAAAGAGYLAAIH